jgi:cell division protein FtsB
MKHSKKKGKWLTVPVIAVGVVIILCALLYFSLTSESSFFNLFRSSKKNVEMEKEIIELNATIDSLKNTIEKLKNDTAYIERIAREKLGMARKDEKVYKFIEKEK